MKFARLLVAACAGWLAISAAAPANAGKSDDTLTVAFRLQLQNLNRYFSPGREGFLLGYWIFDSLLYRDPDTFEYKPALATQWAWVNDLTLDFTLREGVKFHNGEEMTADDVVFTYNYIADPETKIFNASDVTWIKSAEKLDKYKLRVHLKELNPLALEYAAKLVIYPKAYYEKVGKQAFGENPVGTGPYKGKLGPSGSAIMTRHDDYYAGSPKGKPAIKNLIYRTIPDPTTQIAELIAGGVDWAYYIPDDQAERLKTLPKLKVVNAETFRIAFLVLDAMGRSDPSSPLKDVRVRRAIAHAVDEQAIARKLVGGSSRVIHSACFPSQFGCTEDVARYAYDVAKAKQLMAEAGYGGGFDTQLYAYRSRPIAETVINYLRAIGIRAQLNWLQYPAVIQARRDNKAPIVVDDWGSSSISDVYAILNFFFDGGPDDFSRDPVVLNAIKRGASTHDPETRKAAYREALRRIADQVYWVTMHTMPVNYVFSADLDFPVPKDEIPQFYRARWK